MADDTSKTLIQRASSRGFDRGFMGGSGLWSIVGAVSSAIRFIQWMDRRDQRKVVIDDLKPGDTLMIEHLEAEPTRRQLRKQAKKQAKQDKKAAAKAKKDHARDHDASSRATRSPMRSRSPRRTSPT